MNVFYNPHVQGKDSIMIYSYESSLVVVYSLKAGLKVYILPIVGVTMNQTEYLHADKGNLCPVRVLNLSRLDTVYESCISMCL